MANKHVVDLVAGTATTVPLTQAEIDQAVLDAQAYAIVQTAKDAETARADSYVADAGRVDLINRLKTATPAQIDTWVNNNATSIAAIQNILKAIIKVIALDARR